MTIEQFPVVGLGASADDISALEDFFDALGNERSMAFVVVTHLDKKRADNLHKVIDGYTPLKVAVAADGDALAAGHVYVLPEGIVATIQNGVLSLEKETLSRSDRRPIDAFFSALAADQGDNSVGVVLSTNGPDGMSGLEVIKGHGGITFAQVASTSDAASLEISRDALTSGLVDFAISARDIPEKLHRVQEGRTHSAKLTQRSERGDKAVEKALQKITLLLRTHSSHDFSRYKSKTFLRRIARRMQVTQDASIEDYADRLVKHAEEVKALYQDLLINVTEFFRDPDAFAALETTVIPQLFKNRSADDIIRVWVPGCSTGEEVYSIAILLTEAMENVDPCPRVQIFATDLDERALTLARAGRYMLPLLSRISDSRRKRFFRKDGEYAVIAQSVRDLCVFSAHNVTSDPPFSRMDLLSCRNLLIYFGRELQDQVIPTFHYALKPGGFLFLGSSESISQHGDLFLPVDQKQRLFQSRGFGAIRPRLPMQLGQQREGQVPRSYTEEPSRASSYHVKQRAEALVLERFAPAHVVIRNEGDIVFYSARTSQYLDMPRGAPTRQIWDLARSELRMELRAALRQAQDTDMTAVSYATVKSSDGKQATPVQITAEPLRNEGEAERLFVVVFSSGLPSQSRLATDQQNDPPEDVMRSEREMRDMRERMQSTVEEYETAIEELRSANEELLSVNEEAQSTNEELEASKEEMQSLNEELNTINGELNGKLVELDRANADLRNLYEATQIATIFLDDSLVIRNFTPAAATFFHLRQGDVGRPLTDLASALQYPELHESIQSVFDNGKMLEHTLPPDSNGEVFLVRLVPYLSQNNRTTGVVVTLVDITNLAKAEAHQRVLIEELNHRVKNMLAVVISISRATWRSSDSADVFIETFGERLQSMARAHTLLSNSGWTSVSLKSILNEELGAYDDWIDLSGPDLELPTEIALSFGLIIHELTTNAAKHGAFSADGGHVSIKWTTQKGQLDLTWQETGGPPVNTPERKGFGLVLLEGQVSAQLGGQIDFSFQPTGLRVELSVPTAS